MVELADQALLAHRGIERAVVALGGEAVAEEFVAAVGLPAEQLVAVEDVQVATIADDAPLHAVDRDE